MNQKKRTAFLAEIREMRLELDAMESKIRSARDGARDETRALVEARSGAARVSKQALRVVTTLDFHLGAVAVLEKAGRA